MTFNKQDAFINEFTKSSVKDVNYESDGTSNTKNIPERFSAKPDHLQMNAYNGERITANPKFMKDMHKNVFNG